MAARSLDLAAAGFLVVGYDCLIGGLRRAEEERLKGVPWGEELVQRWRRAVQGYDSSYSLEAW